MYDAIVIGGGPGGSIAATILGQQGAKTLLIDRESFPRDKSCGDAVQAACFAIMRQVGLSVSLRDHNFFQIERVQWIGPGGIRLMLDLTPEHGEGTCVIPRYIFDELLYQHALISGVEAVCASVTGLIQENNQVVGVKAKSKNKEIEYYGRLVIAADGATSTVARSLNASGQPDKNVAIAMRGYVETTVDLEHVIDFSFMNSIQPGYAWFFPTGKRCANVGVGVRADIYKKQSLSLSDALGAYLESPEVHRYVGNNKLQNIKTWQLPFYSAHQQRVFDGVLLIGDAGGFVNPLTGAGIYTAMITGKCAGEASMSALRKGDTTAKGLMDFENLWRKELAWEMNRANLISKMLVAFPGLIDGVLSLSQLIPGLTYSIIGKV